MDDETKPGTVQKAIEGWPQHSRAISSKETQNRADQRCDAAKDVWGDDCGVQGSAGRVD
jgi:hypothetical protein